MKFLKKLFRKEPEKDLSLLAEEMTEEDKKIFLELVEQENMKIVKKRLSPSTNQLFKMAHKKIDEGDYIVNGKRTK